MDSNSNQDEAQQLPFRKILKARRRKTKPQQIPHRVIQNEGDQGKMQTNDKETNTKVSKLIQKYKKLGTHEINK